MWSASRVSPRNSWRVKLPCGRSVATTSSPSRRSQRRSAYTVSTFFSTVSSMLVGVDARQVEVDDEVVAPAVGVHGHAPGGLPGAAVRSVPQLLGQAVEVAEGVETHQHRVPPGCNSCVVIDRDTNACQRRCARKSDGEALKFCTSHASTRVRTASDDAQARAELGRPGRAGAAVDGAMEHGGAARASALEHPPSPVHDRGVARGCGLQHGAAGLQRPEPGRGQLLGRHLAGAEGGRVRGHEQHVAARVAPRLGPGPRRTPRRRSRRRAGPARSRAGRGPCPRWRRSGLATRSANRSKNARNGMYSPNGTRCTFS